MRIEHNNQLLRSLKDFMNTVVGSFNEQWGTTIQVVEVETTDTELAEVQGHNFIYLRTMLTDGIKETYWTSKLTPTEYYMDCIDFIYLPILHPSFEIQPGTVQYWKGEILSQFRPRFIDAAWDCSLYNDAL